MHRLERFFLDVAVMAVIVLALMIFFDVVSLNLFNKSVPDTVIIVRELMVVAILMPLAAATAQRAHISVEFVTNHLPPKVVSWFIVFGSIFALLALSPMILSGYKDLLHQWKIGSEFYGDLGLPQWPGRLAFVMGILLCWIRLLILVFQDIHTIVTKGQIDLS